MSFLITKGLNQLSRVFNHLSNRQNIALRVSKEANTADKHTDGKNKHLKHSHTCHQSSGKLFQILISTILTRLDLNCGAVSFFYDLSFHLVLFELRFHLLL